MRNKLLFSLLIAFSFLLFAMPARADGIIIPDPPPEPFPRPVPISQLVIRYHYVDVIIDDQIAVTRVDQVFYNPNDWAVEGTYIFPIPPQAAVSDFSLWIDGSPVKAELLDAEQAREIYEDIVSQMKDPALLEYADQDAMRARIFPIPPQGERRIELEYTEVLQADNGLVRYLYPLNTEKFSTQPLEEVRISIDLRASIPIRAVYSPSHPVAIDRRDGHQISVGFEQSNVKPDKDFALYYSLGETQALHLLTYRDPSGDIDPDGFFLLLLAPRPDAVVETVSKDVILVLDRSGSMEGEKFLQAQGALSYILQHLNPEDRFNLIAFSTGLETYSRGLSPSSEREQALDWVNRLSAMGSTDINRALLEAVAMTSSERPTYLIFLTDGLPTEGVVDSEDILENLANVAHENLRLFTFGVGYDVDTFLLDSLAKNHHGASMYVLPGEQLDEIVSTFYAKISTPVLTNLSLDFGDVTVYDVYPTPLPDLFVGSQIVALGRYRQSGMTEISLSGVVNGEVQTFRYPNQWFREASPSGGNLSSIPRLWATRKIGHLLNQIRLNGPDQETVDQIVKLSIRYGIVTPYTSYLVTEPMPLGADNQDRLVEEQFAEMELELNMPAYGRDAVEKAAEQGALQVAESVSSPSEEASDVVRFIGARTFVLKDGVWIDTAFDPESMETIKVAFTSDDYFALAENSPVLGAAFALGDRVIAFADGVAYEVVSPDIQVDPIDIPTKEVQVAQETKLPQTPILLGTPVPDSTPTPGSLSNPGSTPCLGGMLPVLLLSSGLFTIVWRSAYRPGRDEYLVKSDL